jgi:hypothetical protein
VKVACEVTAILFPGVTPPQALKEALCAAATAAGTNAGADTGSLLFLIAAAVPGLREVDVVEGQDEYTTDAGTMVEVVEEAEGGPARITTGISWLYSHPFFSFLQYPVRRSSLQAFSRFGTDFPEEALSAGL